MELRRGIPAAAPDTVANRAPARDRDRRRVLAADTALALVLALLAVLVVQGAPDTFGSETVNKPDSPLLWAVALGGAWAIPFRRLAPTWAVAAGGVLQAVIWSQAIPDSVIPTAVLIYTAAAAGTVAARRAAITVAALLTLFTVFGVLAEDVPVYALPIVGLFTATSAALGWITASRQAYTEAMVARAEALERSRQRDRERALVDERARIARELHDVVAHGLSVIVVQASAARRILDRDPQGTASALEQIEHTGRNALNEMRQVLAAIRTEPGESWQPAPGLDALDALVEELTATGLDVTITRAFDRGDQPLDPLPATVDVTAYRIVQESLTNVLKHGGSGARASVEVVRQPRTLRLRIADDGRGPGRRRPGEVEGDGQGLRGMQERVEVFGGEFAAGPRPGGGFEVAVLLPIDGRAPSTAGEPATGP